MKDKFEKELVKVLNEKEEIPSVVRVSLDNSYNKIRTMSKKKNRIDYKIAIAACCIIVSIAMLTNDSVRAGVMTFFNFGDKGVNQAIDNGFLNDGKSSVTNNDIQISLESYFADSNKIGLSFKVKFNDSNILNDKVDKVTLDYRIKNGDGEYIEEYIPDTKKLKGENKYMSSFNDKNSEINIKNNEVQYEVILGSYEGDIPKLENAVVEVETVNIFYKNSEGLKEFNGKWNLELNNVKSDTVHSVNYKVESSTPGIEITSASAQPTSFTVTFEVDGIYQDENTFCGMKLIDEKGEEYTTDGYSREIKGNKTIVSTNFPLSSYKNMDKITLKIGAMGEAKLKK